MAQGPCNCVFCCLLAGTRSSGTVRSLYNKGCNRTHPQATRPKQSFVGSKTIICMRWQALRPLLASSVLLLQLLLCTDARQVSVAALTLCQPAGMPKCRIVYWTARYKVHCCDLLWASVPIIFCFSIAVFHSTCIKQYTLHRASMDPQLH